MRLKIAVAVILSVLFGISIHFNTVQAEGEITEKKISLIRDHCVENLATLNRLHQTDAFLRTDRGDLYRTINDKLMVPLNRRLAANKLDGGELLTITANFNDEYNDFYNTYIAYDNALSKVLHIDCTKEPVSFYNALLDAREKRTQLSAINLKLKDLIRQYGVAFTSFKDTFLKEHT
jgi:hypothetical protein